MGDSKAHRKIELQSPQDLSHLISNGRAGIAELINRSFPPIDGADGQGPDKLRVEIEQMMEQWLQKTWSLAAPNLSINGNESIDPTPYLSGTDATQEAEEAFEAFDSRKLHKYFALVAEEQDLLKEIAALKKFVPVAAATGWAESIKTGMEGDEETLERVRGEVVGRVEGSGRKMLGEVKMERRDEVEGKFAEAVETLGRLKRDMPATVAKMERARVAGGYVVAGK